MPKPGQPRSMDNFQAIQAGLKEDGERRREEREEKETGEPSGLEKLLQEMGVEGKKAEQILEILKHLRERQARREQLAYFEIELSEAVRKRVIENDILGRAEVELEDGKGGKMIVFGTGESWERRYYVPADAPRVIIERKGSDEEGERRYQEEIRDKRHGNYLLVNDCSKDLEDSGRAEFVELKDAKILLLMEELNEETKKRVEGDGQYESESAVLQDVIRGIGATQSNRYLVLEGNKLTFDFRRNPSTSFFQNILKDIIIEDQNVRTDENRYDRGDIGKYVYHEPGEIGEAIFVDEDDEEFQRRQRYGW